MTAFASIKGGVGKTTLAVMHARALAAQGRAPAVLDLDWTGTSIADALNLSAPQMPTDVDGRIRWNDPPAGMVSGAALRALRNKRRDHGPERWVPYLNDWLLANEGYGAAESYLWRGVGELADTTRYLPSAALFRDIGAAVALLKDKDRLVRWEASLRRAMNALVASGMTDIVVDLPPGLYGLSEVFLATLHRPGGIVDQPLTARAWLVATPEKSALLPTIEFYWRTRRAYPLFDLLGNRVRVGRSEFERMCDALADGGNLPRKRLRHVDENEGLADSLARGILPAQEVLSGE